MKSPGLKVQMAWHTRKLALLKILLVMWFMCHLSACLLGMVYSFDDHNVFWLRNGFCHVDEADVDAVMSAITAAISP